MTIYKITCAVDQGIDGPVSEVRLIEAKTKVSAVAFVAAHSITAEICTVADAMALAKKGIEIEPMTSGTEK